MRHTQGDRSMTARTGREQTSIRLRRQEGGDRERKRRKRKEKDEKKGRKRLEKLRNREHVSGEGTKGVGKREEGKRGKEYT